MNIQAINAELAKIGYRATKLPKKAVDRLTVWNPQTAAGRRCKAYMKFWASWPKPIGVKDYQVKGMDGQWYSDWMDGFAHAAEYQRCVTANWELCKDL